MPASPFKTALPAAESDIPRFTFLSYLKDRLAGVAWAAACLACTSFFLSVMGLGPSSVAFIALFAASCAAAAFAARYARARRFWKDSASLAESVDRPEIFCALVGEPRTLEARIALGIAEALVAKGTRETDALRAEMRAEREYSELWTHEVKTPLAASRLALAGMHGETASVLKEQLERTESLVEQALYKSRVSSLAADYVIAETSLLKCAREACKQNMRFLVARGVAVEFDVDEDATVLADGSWLRFIVSQLVLNAAKYDAKTIRFRAQESEEGTDGQTLLEVADDGCGIPARDVPRVFDRGFTGQVGRSHGSATGMGLYLVAQMCTNMGLDVSIASEEGAGTRVTIAFPHDRRRMRAEASLASGAAAPRTPSAPGEGECDDIVSLP